MKSIYVILLFALSACTLPPAVVTLAKPVGAVMPKTDTLQETALNPEQKPGVTNQWTIVRF